jgi:hypothetical protein
MRKIIFLFALIILSAGLKAVEIHGFPDKYLRSYDDNMNRIRLMDNANILENKYSIKTYLYLELKKDIKDTEAEALAVYYMIKKEPGSRVLLIWFSRDQNRGEIILSDNLKAVFPDEYIETLRDDVLNNLMGKWYISEPSVLTKVLGGFVYILEKNNMTKADIERDRDHMIIVDDPLYSASRKPLMRDIMGLFYMEPVSFIFYFPFVMYIIIVRWAGMKFGQNGFYISNIIWLVFMAFTAAMLIARVNIYFHEYAGLFCIFIGMNLPVYLILYSLNQNRINSALYHYLYDVTGGGFEKLNLFEGSRWENK